MEKNFKIKLFFLSCFLGITLLQNNINAQPKRYATVFYSVWANLVMPSSLYGNDVYNMSSTIYSPYPDFNWWGKPAYCATHGDLIESFHPMSRAGLRLTRLQDSDGRPGDMSAAI